MGKRMSTSVGTHELGLLRSPSQRRLARPGGAPGAAVPATCP